MCNDAIDLILHDFWQAHFLNVVTHMLFQCECRARIHTNAKLFSNVFFSFRPKFEKKNVKRFTLNG